MVVSHYVGDGTDPGPMQKQQVFLISEPSLQQLAITSPAASQHNQIGEHISNLKPLGYRSKPQGIASEDPELESMVM